MTEQLSGKSGTQVKHTGILEISPVNLWKQPLSRREALRFVGGGAALLAGASLSGCDIFSKQPEEKKILINEVPPLREYVSPNPNQKAIIIPLLAKGDTPPQTHDQLMQIAQGANDIWQQSSYKKIKYTFDVLDWQTTNQPIDQNDPAKMLTDIAEAGDKAAEKTNVQDIGQFQTRIYIMKTNDTSFGAAGRGEKRDPKAFNRAWIDAGVFFALTDPELLAHEIGHTLGLGHDGQGGQDAGGASLMGIERGDVNVCQKIALGWVTKEHVQTITPQTQSKNGIYEVSFLEAPHSEGTLAIRIPFKKFDPQTNQYQRKFYYVQCNKPVYNQMHPGLLDEGGIQLREWDEEVGSDTKQLWLNHTDTQKSSTAPAPLAVDGDFFYDQELGIRIRQVHHTDKSISVQVLYDKK